MDKALLNKIKILLANCNPDNVDIVKSKIMVALKPTEADLAYEYFSRIEPYYIQETYKVYTSQVIPQYNDYFKPNSSVEDVILDDFRDLD